MANAFDYQSFLKTLTRRPGVYRMLDAEGAVLYVGKARDLKARVSSYFRGQGLTSKTLAMVQRIARVETTVTGSEIEALLLEQSLIKAERPPFNILLRDDKSYPMIALTEHKDFPRLRVFRGRREGKGKTLFGPFPSAGAVRETLTVLQKLFRLRSCTDSNFANRSRPCLQFQIGRCSGPCVGLIDEASYRADLRHALLFLEGRSDAVTAELEVAMASAAEALAFEEAARLRDQISKLRRIQQQQHMVTEGGDVDVFSLLEEGGMTCIIRLGVRRGQVLATEHWWPDNALGLASEALLGEFLAQFYFGEEGSGSGDRPREVLTSHALPDATILGEALSQAFGYRVRLSHQVRGQRASWLRLAEVNGQAQLTQRLEARGHGADRLAALTKALGQNSTPERMECFDISHTGGEGTVASCVVFEGGQPKKSDYRRFNIEGITPGDDYAAMHQALERRYARVKRGEAPMPDLLIIDGGPGQLTQARAVLEALELTRIHLLGIAKGVTRKAGLEQVIDGATGRVLALAPSDRALHLLQHIRDEAHRFAITGHRQRRGKQRTQSSLEGIEGIGPKRRRALLAHFGGLKGVRNASVDDLRRVPGINAALAQSLYHALHGA